MAGTQTTSRGATLDSSTEGSSKKDAVVGKTKELAGDAKHQIAEKTSGLGGTAKTKVTTMADDRREQLVDKAQEFESGIRSATSTLRDEQPQVADAIEKVVDRVSPALNYVENTSIDRMLTDLTAQAKRRPLLVTAAMFGAGFLLSRALKPVEGVSLTGGETNEYDYEPAQLPRTTSSYDASTY